MLMKHLKRIIWLMFVFSFFIQFLMGQDTKTKLQFNGNIGLFGDFYSMESDSIGAVSPRRPGTVGRFVANATLSYGAFSLPLSLMLSEGQTSVITPHYQNRNFINYIKDPSNRVGIAPKYKWIQILLGTQVPQYSELSIGDLPVFGAGIALTPGLFRFSCYTGTTQIAIEEDTTKNIQGVYSRKMYSGKLGYGKEDDSHFYIISSYMVDDTSSLKRKPVNTLPQKGLLSSIDYRVNLGKQIYFKGEFAGSAFTRDTRSKVITETNISIPYGIYSIQESSRFSYASVFSIAKDGKKFGLKLNAKYIGDGFVPLGYPFMQSDRMEATISPRFSLFKDKVLLTGSYGKRINNLTGNRAATNTQSIGNVDLNAQITEKFSFSASISNLDFRNTISNDTFRIQMVTSSWSLSPTYTFTTEKNLHVITLLCAQNTFTDYNTISGALNANNSINALLSYMLVKVKSPFNTSIIFSYFNDQTTLGIITSESATLNFGYKFFNKKLTTSTGVSFTENKLDTQSSGRLITTNLGLKYSLNKKINVSLNGSINLFKYGVDRPSISYRENVLRTSITYKF